MVSLFTGTVSTLVAACNMFFIAFPQFFFLAVFRNQVSPIHSVSLYQLCRAISWWGASSSVSLKQAFLQNVKKYEACQRGGWRDGLICPLTHLPPGQWQTWRGVRGVALSLVSYVLLVQYCPSVCSSASSFWWANRQDFQKWCWLRHFDVVW